MIILKKMFVFLAIVAGILFLAGCINGPANGSNNSWVGTQGNIKTCRLVAEETPYTEQVCNDLSESKEECAMRELNYSAGKLIESDICMSGAGNCGGEQLINCIPGCTQANKRCRMTITNLDPQHQGTWTMGATFVYSGQSFVKVPVSIKLAPGESGTFDFLQIYGLGDRPTQATCTLSMIYPAIVQDCKTITHLRTDCKNITKTKLVEKEICE
ncbi:MAG: hypothetical protein V1492_03430 [Candidatus Micrarchaeota archaeon]